MTFSLVNSGGFDFTPAGAQQVFTYTIPWATSVGDLLWLPLFDGEGINATCTVSDNANGAWVQDAQANIPVDDDTASQFSRVITSATAANGTIVTITRPANVGGSMRGGVTQQHDSAGPFPSTGWTDTANIKTGYNASSASASAGPTGTLAQANSLITASVMQSSLASGPDTAGGGATLIFNANGTPFKVANSYLGVSATTPVSVSFTLGAADEWRCFLVPYRGFVASSIPTNIYAMP